MNREELITWRGEFARIAQDTSVNRGLMLPTLGRCGTCWGDVARAVSVDVDAVEVGRWKHLVQATEADHRVELVDLDPARWPVGEPPAGPITAGGGA